MRQPGLYFCSAGGSGDFAARRDSWDSIATQLEKGKHYFHDKKTGKRYIAYFQAYTNTYAPAARLESYTVRRLMSRLSWEYP